MNNLNKKQKIIFSVIVIMIMLAVCYYVYAKDESFDETELIIENLVEEEENIKEQENNETIIVHVSGCVQAEGVYKLNQNSRVEDAINKAGGLKTDADLTNINLAEIIEDGIKIYIPSKSEQENIVQNSMEFSANTVTNNTKSKKVNINKATQEELDTLPGIGLSTALKIIQYRKENGKFFSKEQIKEVSGIGDSKYEKIKDYITVK